MERVRPIDLWTTRCAVGRGRPEAPLKLDDELAGGGRWEVELGFGKGRFLLASAAASPSRRFLGIELAGAYYRLARDRAQRRKLDNLLLIRGEALYVLTALLPQGFAKAVHVYFPDPWPKSRHHRRRLFSPQTVDLVLGLLSAGGRLYFATDFLAYGRRVRALLESHPALEVGVRDAIWEGGARTNYESKYEREGRPILRLEARRRADSGGDLFHPRGRNSIVAAAALAVAEDEEA